MLSVTIRGRVGVGVAGGREIGSWLVSPATLAYCPHSQQVVCGSFGRRMIQKSLYVLLPTTSAVCPTFNDPNNWYMVPGPVRQLVSVLTVTLGVEGVKVGVEVLVNWEVSDG